MRDIRFRGFDKKCGCWRYGYYYSFVAAGKRIATIMNEEGSNYMVDPETVGQYTSLKDKNGTPIYEGDIAVGEHATYLIRWDDKMAQFKCKIVKTNSVLIKHSSFPLWQYIEDDGKCRFEIIGNIYEHPHLLEGDENE